LCQLKIEGRERGGRKGKKGRESERDQVRGEREEGLGGGKQ
jgi:hypothetical protein